MPRVSDDWRLTIDMQEGGRLDTLLDALRSERLAHEARGSVGGRVVVTHDGPHVFLYADSEAQALAAAAALGPLLAEHGVDQDPRLERWHPVEERWEPPEVPVAEASPEAAQREHERLEAADRAASREQGFPEWEVRLALPGHTEARELADRLEAEGMPTTRRWRYVLVGAETEDDARALAQRLRNEAPDGTELLVEVNGQDVWRQLHPYAVLGGLAN